MPERIQRKRTRGWRMPPNTIYVGRPTRWGNPFSVTQFYRPGVNTLHDAVHESIMAYRAWLAHADQRLVVDAIRAKLRGYDLACWCRLDEPCHADVLLEIANSDEE